MTVLHAGGKFDHASYKVSGGLHGVGVSVVNALSEWLKLEIRRDGKVYYQEYRRGDPVDGARGDRRHRPHAAPRSRSSPTPRSSSGIEFSFDILSQRLRELAFLNSGPADHHRATSAADKTHEFNFEGGIAQFVADLNTTQDRRPRQADLRASTSVDGTQVEVAMQWNDSYQRARSSASRTTSRTRTAARTSPGFRAALTRTVNTYAQRGELLKDLKAGPRRRGRRARA